MNKTFPYEILNWAHTQRCGGESLNEVSPSLMLYYVPEWTHKGDNLTFIIFHDRRPWSGGYDSYFPFRRFWVHVLRLAVLIIFGASRQIAMQYLKLGTTASFQIIIH
jgi:hypothetical protein